MGDTVLSESKEKQPGEKSEIFCCYFAGGLAPNGQRHKEGYYTRYAWVYVLGYDPCTLDLVHEAGPSIDTPPPGYTVKTEPIGIIDTGTSGGGGGELSGSTSGTTSWTGPWG